MLDEDDAGAAEDVDAIGVYVRVPVRDMEACRAKVGVPLFLSLLDRLRFFRPLLVTLELPLRRPSLLSLLFRLLLIVLLALLLRWVLITLPLLLLLRPLPAWLLL